MAIQIETVGNGVLFNGALTDKQGWILSASSDQTKVVLTNRITGLSSSSAVTEVEVDGSTFADYDALVAALGDVLFKSSGTGSDGVQSVNGDTGPAVVLDATDVGAAPASHTHPASQISDSTATGRSVLTAASAAAARTTIGAGTSNLALGTTASTAAAGNHTHANATTSAGGFMSASDKNKLDSLSGFTTYYISPTGNDSSNGLTPATAWQTLAKVSSIPSGQAARVLLQSGQSFSGSIGFVGKTSGLVISTYNGYEKATINMIANTDPGVNIYNCSNVTIDNIKVVGAGVGTWIAKSGILIFNDTLLNGENYKITNCEVTNVGYYGITVGMDAAAGTIKIRGLEISHCNVYNNIDGIFVYGNLDHEYSIEKAVIERNVTYGNLGSASVTWTHSGNGLMLCGLDGGIVQHNVSFGNGQNNAWSGGGPYGIWMYNCNATLIQFCQSFLNLSGNGKDGGGFDIDGGCQGCGIMYCDSYQNQGPAILMYQFDDADNAWANNYYKFNTSYNDGRSGNTGAIMYGGELTGAVVSDNKITFDSTDLAILSGLVVAVNDTDTVDITLARNSVYISDDILPLPVATSKLLLSNNVVTYVNGEGWITNVNSKQENGVGQIVDNVLVFENGALPATGDRQATTVYIEKSV